MTSRKLLVKDERQEDWEAVEKRWFDEYLPTEPFVAELVKEAAQAEWFRIRADREHDKLCEALFETEQADWTEEQHKKYERCLRYQTTVERRCQRTYARLEQHLRTRRIVEREERAEVRREEAATEPKKKVEAQQKAVEKVGPEKPRPLKRFPQWVVVHIVDGKTRTSIDPPNEGIHWILAKSPETLVIRFMEFLDGVPPEYEWTTDDPVKRATKHWKYKQVMRPETWRQAIARETDGHIGPVKDLDPPGAHGEG